METKENFIKRLPLTEDAEKNAAVTPYAMVGGNILKLDKGGGYKEISLKELVGDLQRVNANRSHAFVSTKGDESLANNIRDVLTAYTNYHIAPAIGDQRESKNETEPFQNYDPLSALAGKKFEKIPEELRDKTVPTNITPYYNNKAHW